MNLEMLSKPFPAKDIEWRVQSAGTKNGKIWAMVLAYVTNRAIMERLDAVVGPGNWRNEYKEWIGGSVLCGLSIKIDGEWVTKWDGAEQTDIEAVKGGLSGAMKRAAVQWGIGRYLYNLEATMATILEHGMYFQAKKEGKYDAFRWNPPSLPAWALPSGEKPAEQAGKKEQPPAEIKTPAGVEESGEIKMVQPGEQLKADHWFWKVPQDKKVNHMPEGYWYSKVDGVWTCTKKAA